MHKGINTTLDEGQTPIVTGGVFDEAVAIHENQRGEVRHQETAPALSVGGGKPGQGYPCVFEPRFARNGRGAPSEVVPALKAQAGETGKGDAAPCVFSAMLMNSGKDYTVRPTDIAQPLTTVQAGNHAQGGDFVLGVTVHGTNKTATAASFTDTAGALRTKPPGSVENSSTKAALHNMAVRRLLPVECERLQGFPDNYTAIPWRGKPAEQCPDGPRYKALGNSMAVPCIRWIGERIQAFNDTWPLEDRK